MLATLLVVLGIAVLGIVVIGVTLAVVGAVVGLVFGLLALAVKAIPLLLAGLIVVKLVRASERRRLGVYAADQRWLDS
ncbi:hypothetical protein [Longimicrobium terrae]|uniref:ABC-type antimicrobial peptide transport system permease subunit n=1 Tax=Longimicrobium terrae TaxID=1639882 RepID=A0A841GPM1_9BACT|nr:hypothetical protein [Longimicrobium terrae]MBB4634927.1 ABC-type antimicrobial peptide transport system permease subunit [Longimicrobium terrae]MBB6069322.1 ABC-type antimicrobial peptide transport system permease subunit [Longimicrobium terrae]NNC31870.1 hypothetical protein [Longimicrobium terrae]